LTHNERTLSFRVPDVYVKYPQNGLKIATVRAQTDTHRQTDRDDTGDLIIWPMLRYSNGENKDKAQTAVLRIVVYLL